MFSVAAHLYIEYFVSSWHDVHKDCGDAPVESGGLNYRPEHLEFSLSTLDLAYF